MGQGDPFARMVKVMQRQGMVYNGFDMAIAQVAGIEPLSIIVNGQLIADHVFYNELLTSNKDEELAEILALEEHISENLKSFLTELYTGCRVMPGDYVLVQRVNNSFYVCGKVAV